MPALLVGAQLSLRTVFFTKVHRCLHPVLKDGVEQPGSLADYNITLDTLPGLACEIIDGL